MHLSTILLLSARLRNSQVRRAEPFTFLLFNAQSCQRQTLQTFCPSSSASALAMALRRRASWPGLPQGEHALAAQGHCRVCSDAYFLFCRAALALAAHCWDYLLMVPNMQGHSTSISGISPGKYANCCGTSSFCRCAVPLVLGLLLMFRICRTW
jgi:hypothetical protein